MSRRRSALRNRVEYLAYRAARAVAHVSGPRTVAAVGATVGELFWWLGRRRREILRFNLALAFPDTAAVDRAALAHAVARHFGRVLLDALRVQTLTPQQLEREVPIAGDEHLHAALARAGHTGTFFLTAHIGSWEVAALRLGLLLANGLAVVNRPLDNPLLDAELQRLRSLFGNSVLGRDRIARDVLRQISSGGGVGILIDQRAKEKEGLQVPLLGHPSPTHPILARLVLKTRAPVLPTFAIWEGPGAYRMQFWAPLFVDELPPEEQEVEGLTMRFMEITEAAIRRWPEQWLWYHDRWRALRLAAAGSERRPPPVAHR